MSEESIIALVAVVSTAVVGLFGLAANAWNSQKDREHRFKEQESEQEERYKFGLYEKRLEIYQRSFSWSQKLGRSAFRIESHGPNELGEGLDEFRIWLDSINLYHDPVSQHELTKLMLRGREVITEKATYPEFTQQLEAAQEALVKGIALKHIDLEGIREDLRRMREESGA